MGDPGEAPAFEATPFRPAWWLPGPHAQTIAGRYLRPKTGVRYRRVRLEAPDGDFVDVDLASVDGFPEPPADAPVLLVVHGLEGGSGSTYVLETCRAAVERGFRPVAMNFRSCSGEPNRTPRFYHAGDSADLAFVLGEVRARFPRSEVFAIGFSLGANVLLKHLGERGEAAEIRAAAAVSVPFDLGAGEEKLSGTVMGRVYTTHFLGRLRRKFHLKRHLLEDACDPERVLSARTFREWDDAATARLHGFRDAEDYYARSSSRGFIPAIRVPTLLIHAADDPFLPETAIPRAAVEASPWLTGVFPARGGHVGFVSGPPWAPRFWAEREAVRFLAGYLR
jgi:predicted alpha/beta-fold hydrolase